MRSSPFRADSSVGTGVIVSEDGYAITAAHLINGGSDVAVLLHSGRRVTARVVSVDVPQDLALVRLAGSGHPCLPVARQGTPPVGTHVYALGAPAADSLAYSVTAGIISSFRPLSGYSYLQTDAILSPTNSGGPILTGDGHVIAIVSWKLGALGFTGLPFGVPLDALCLRLFLSWR